MRGNRKESALYVTGKHLLGMARSDIPDSKSYIIARELYAVSTSSPAKKPIHFAQSFGTMYFVQNLGLL